MATLRVAHPTRIVQLAPRGDVPSSCLRMTRSGTPLLAALVVFGLGIGTRARSDPGHGLTPPEPPKFRPPRGAVFVDDFKSGHLERWRADRAGVWSVKRGMLKAELPDAKQEHSLLFA